MYMMFLRLYSYISSRVLVVWFRFDIPIYPTIHRPARAIMVNITIFLAIDRLFKSFMIFLLSWGFNIYTERG